MTLPLELLTTRIRQLMLAEVDADVRGGCLYMSPRLSPTGAVSGYLPALREAIAHGTDLTLAAALTRGGFLKWQEIHHAKNGGAFIRSVPRDASRLLAVEAFTLYYLRALVVHAKQDAVEVPQFGSADSMIT